MQLKIRNINGTIYITYKRNFNRQKRTKLSKDKILEKGDAGSSLSIFKKKTIMNMWKESI